MKTGFYIFLATLFLMTIGCSKLMADKKYQIHFLNSKNLEEWDAEKKKIKQVLNDIMGPFPDKKTELNVKILSEEDMGDFIRTKVSYNVEQNEQVNAWLLVPKDLKKPSPAVLALHQTTQDGKDEVVGISNNKDMRYGEDLVKQGFIVLAPDALSAGERIFDQYDAYDSKPFYVSNPHWSMIGKAIWDNQIALDYLLSLKFVDKKNIFVIGHSEGAIDAIFLAAFDKRISAVALSCGLTTIQGDPDPYRWSRDSWFVAFPKLKKYLDKGNSPFDFHQVVALIAPTPLLSFSASDDQILKQYKAALVINQEASKIYRLYHKPENLGIYVFQGNHSFPENNKLLIYSWLQHQVIK